MYQCLAWEKRFILPATAFYYTEDKYSLHDYILPCSTSNSAAS